MDLPVIGAAPVERADAARNRRAILAAAERLFAERGVRGTSMDAIAAEAGVGKGTLFRRFGDRGALAQAVLDATERDLQEAIVRGAPPLGPGAPPVERLIAFGAVMLERLELHGEIMLEAEMASPTAWLRPEPRAVHWLHIRTLVEQARPGCDVGYVTDALLGVLSPRLVLMQRRLREMPLERLKAGYADLVVRLLGADPPPPGA
jgi:AcrR family transcriptional regulator